MASTIGRGLLAGAVGTTLLNAASYLDMALTDRPPSGAPTETTSRVLDRLGVASPNGKNARDAYGAVAGIATGLGIGVVASLLRRAGMRLPAPLGATAVGALAMAAADVPMAALGVSDPRTWTAADWTRDVVPHLAYGVGVRWTLDRTEPAATGQDVPSVTRRTGEALAKSLAMGIAAGGRSSLGLAAPLLVASAPRAKLLGGSLVVGEMLIDKLPSTPSRLEGGPLVGRALAGAVGGAVVTARRSLPALLPIGAAVGVAGSLAGSVLGAAWREVAQQQGYTWQAALVEDAVSVGLAAYALS